VVFKAVVKNLHLDSLPAIEALQHGPGRRQPSIPFQDRFGACLGLLELLPELVGRAQPQKDLRRSAFVCAFPCSTPTRSLLFSGSSCIGIKSCFRIILYWNILRPGPGPGVSIIELGGFFAHEHFLKEDGYGCCCAVGISRSDS
jgi:hypothetical protein